MASERELIDAINLICEHVSGKLPDRWEITVILSGDEQISKLRNPDGNVVKLFFGEGGLSSITSMINYAKENDHFFESDGE